MFNKFEHILLAKTQANLCIRDTDCRARLKYKQQFIMSWMNYFKELRGSEIEVQK